MSRTVSSLILAAAVSLGGIPFAQGQTVAPPKMRVGIVPAVDRFVTLTDGSRVYQGLEISYLLGQTLLASSAYVPVMLSTTATTTTSTSTSTTASTLASATVATPAAVSSVARLSQIPTEWTTWTKTPEVLAETQGATTDTGVVSGFPVAVDLTVTPVVETLEYSSGQKSDRVFFGFSPDHINPFNAGEVGGLDNQYVATSAQIASCQMPDFFNGELNAAGVGPLAGNFGANMDEGFSFGLMGFGLTFKKIQFTVESQIRFLVDNNRTGAHNEYVFQTTGSGSDVFVDGAYEGFTLGFEIQRTHTLLSALQAMLPQIVNGVVAQALGTTWENSVIAVANTGPTMGAGVNEGVNLGLKLASPFGNIYEVTNVGGTTSTLIKVSGATQPFVGEPLRVYTGNTHCLGVTDDGRCCPVDRGNAGCKNAGFGENRHEYCRRRRKFCSEYDTKSLRRDDTEFRFKWHPKNLSVDREHSAKHFGPRNFSRAVDHAMLWQKHRLDHQHARQFGDGLRLLALRPCF